MIPGGLTKAPPPVRTFTDHMGQGPVPFRPMGTHRVCPYGSVARPS
jgi:hypothetical protein